MGGKSSKNAWDETESVTPEVAPQEYRRKSADESAYSSSIPQQNQGSALPQPPGQVSTHDYGSIREQPAPTQQQQPSPQQQRPASYIQQPSPYKSQQPLPYLQQSGQTNPGIANGNAAIYYNQAPTGYEKSPEPTYQTHLYDEQRHNQLPNGYTATPTATPPEKQGNKKSKKSKSSKSKKSKGKSPEKETVNESSGPSQDPGEHINVMTRTIPRAVFDRERFMIDHGVRPSNDIHVDTTQSNEDSGRGSYGKNDDVRAREQPQRRDENIVYTPSTKTKEARRPLLYPSALQNDAHSQPSSTASEPVQLPETETRSTGSHSHEVVSTDPPEQPTGFVQVLPSEPFRGWNRSQNRGEYGSGSPNFSGYRREIPGSTESRYSYGRESRGSGFPDIDY